MVWTALIPIYSQLGFFSGLVIEGQFNAGDGMLRSHPVASIVYT